VCPVAVVRGDSKVSGSVIFEQENESSPTTVTWDITGHDANAKRGMHIHTFGDNTNGCTSAGPHCRFPMAVLHLTWVIGRPVVGIYIC
jgi:Cu/Zn superoxide dismutase